MHANEVVRAIRRRALPIKLLPFHAEFLREAWQPDIDIAALSIPRGGGKSWLAAQLAAEAIDPAGVLYQERVETVLVSGSLEQSRIVLAFVKEALNASDEFRWLDSTHRLSVTHKATGTRLRIISSSGKRAMGLSQFGLIIADEPGSWEVREGQLMFSALSGALGKRPGQKLVLIGTRKPAPDGTWWPDLLDAGSGHGIHVTERSAPPEEPWDAWPTIRRVNPVLNVNPSLRRRVLRERDNARRNPTLRADFEAYKLNRPVDTFTEPLVKLAEWRLTEARELPARGRRCIVGLDLGATRSWSAAWCLWPNGRSEAFAVVAGIPDLAERERADAMPDGLYSRLVADGVLLVDEGLHQMRPQVLVDHLVACGITPSLIVCDRFHLPSLRDAVAGRWPITVRQTRWSEATEDIAAFRRLVTDGPLSVAAPCRRLVKMALTQAEAKSDDQGSVRLVKRRGNRSRDDVAVAGVLAAGEWARRAARPKRRQPRHALVG